MLTRAHVFCLLLGVSSDFAQPIAGKVTEVTCPVIGRAQPELTPSKRRKTGPELTFFTRLDAVSWHTVILSYIAFWCPFTNVLTLIPARIRNDIDYEVWDEITYPFSNFNSETVEVWERISNSNPYITGHVITYPYWY